MGVDMKIWLPHWARGDDIGETIALCAGGATAKKIMFERGDGWFTEVEGVSYMIADAGVGDGDVKKLRRFPSMVGICAKDLRGQARHVFLHTEAEGGEPGEKLLMPRSNPFWVAIGRRLIKRFGGRLDISDCDESECDEEVSGCDAIFPKDLGDDSYERRQEILLGTEILSPDELLSANEVATYKYEEQDPETENEEVMAYMRIWRARREVKMLSEATGRGRRQKRGGKL